MFRGEIMTDFDYKKAFDNLVNHLSNPPQFESYIRAIGIKDQIIKDLVSALKVCVVGNNVYQTMSQADKDLYDQAIKSAKQHFEEIIP
jgi:hypothetical protein